jgi:ribosomal protein S18 acetylase RimI-like enzyme
MAALSDLRGEALVELRRITAEALGPLLDEEIETWRRELDWDFQPSASLVRRFLNIRALSGFALMSGAEIAGYCYYVCEESKGLIGDLFVRQAFRTAQRERALVDALLDAIWRTPGVKRVEAQLMMLSAPLERDAQRGAWFRAYPREFLDAPLGGVAALPWKMPGGVSIVPWSENRQDDTARLIAAAYEGHVDSQINDQYRSPGGARRFLMNIVQYPGCGVFFVPASFAAQSNRTGELAGISLASLVAPDVGHITQICVLPEVKGIGLGYELMRQSLTALAAHGCRMASLTVTASNEQAIRLYQSMGLKKRRDFSAYVWQRR